ncbi:alpha/beta hydrolase [Spirosoma sp. BT702]|uniref:Alpha/beta hydrolase n=1 Tax=Spirosoma profusum TaxID=2771354 RepID=A0A926Y0S6_9BACT|nr:alpha/beta hydrolase [Spirosoma profusum]MBD2703786.1 alpha/beta hydrolase [Spirosoma profusum]
MKTYRQSTFKKPDEAVQFLENWNQEVELLNGFKYQQLTIQTAFGNTRVWAANPHLVEAPTLVFFPGARTCGLFWDMDNVLAPFRDNCRYYIVDVNGQPSLSDGQYLNIKSRDYGYWAAQLLDALDISKATILGASLGGLICLNLCLVAPQRVHKAILLNPAGIQPFSLSIQNLFYNILPVVWPSSTTISKFLNKAIFCAPFHQPSSAYRNLIDCYFLYVLRNHRFKGDYPAPLPQHDLARIQTDIYLILGENDLLFPPRETQRLAAAHIPGLRASRILPQTGHGIETSRQALQLAFEFFKQASSAVVTT